MLCLFIFLELDILISFLSFLFSSMTREEEMKEAAAAAADEAETAMDKLRCLLLTRGYNGIMQFGR